MSGKLLNNQVIFKCCVCTASVFKAATSCSNVRIDKTNSLSTTTVLKIVTPSSVCPLIPPLPSGIPSPCRAVTVSGVWKNTSGVIAEGNKLLTEKSSISCSYGGEIKPFAVITNVGGK